MRGLQERSVRAPVPMGPMAAMFAASAAMWGCGVGIEDPGVEEKTGASVTTPQTPLPGNSIPKFVDALPLLSGTRQNGSVTLNVTMQEFQSTILPASVYAGKPAPFNNGTFMWGYNINGAGASFPARTIQVNRGTATTAQYTNNLTNTRLQSLITVDQSLHWADPLGTTARNNCVNGFPLAAACLLPYTGPIPATVHLHGAEVLSQYDGNPDSWWTPGVAQRGRGFVTTTYNYVNQQEATTLWYHDHALGVVRENVFAGLAGTYLIRDGRDTGAANNPITLPAGAFEQELMLADRSFDTNGQLLFPDDAAANPDIHPFWAPEFFGDVQTVNGKAWPVMNVQPRRYRFRVVNASNARFYTMQLFNQAGVPMTTNGPAGPAIWQIGSDGGFLNNAVQLANPANGNHQCDGLADTGILGNSIDIQAWRRCLFLAPAERADIIIDFAGRAGQTLTLKNFAAIPFPGGDPVGFGAPDATSDGLVMQFRVNQPLQGTDTSFNPAGNHPALRATPMVNVKPANGRGDRLRQLILVEEEAGFGPEIPGAPDADGEPVESLINNTKWNGNREGTTTPVPGSISNGRGVTATEVPQEGSTEVWEVANISGDAHPVHIHLIQFQVISRQPFDVATYLADWIAAFPGGTFNGHTFAPGVYIPGFGPPLPYFTPNSAGAVGGNLNFDAAKYLLQGACAGGACPSRPPEAAEAGWKDTIKMFPGEITRLALRWAPQGNAAGSTRPGTDYFPFDPTNGPGYVEHCHILDHEDNEFMRPLLIGK